MGAGGLWSARPGAQGIARVRAGLTVGVLVLGTVFAAGCGEDKEEPPPSEEGDKCVGGTVFTCYDSLEKCSGSRLCIDGQFGPCNCTGGDRDSGSPPNMRDGSIDMEDASMSPPDGGGDDPDASDPPEGDEDCDNGEDDDGDGDVDCADDDCNRSSCVPEAPDDFDGPFLTFIGGSDAPSCGGAYGDEGPSGGAGLVAPAADCSTCTCNASGANSCAAFVNLEAGGDNSCAGGCSNTLAEAACVEDDWACIGGDPTANVRAVLPASAGSCTPSAQDADIDPASFAQHAQTCAPDAELARNGCGQDELCAPSTPFDGVYCVTREGEHDCPEGDYSERHVFYGGIDDDRACSDCECERDCDYTVELFEDADGTCMDAAAATLSITSPSEAQAASSCQDAPVGTGNTLRASLTIDGTGQCAASGGDAEGSATGSDPITFCCLQ